MTGQALFPDGAVLKHIFDEPIQNCRISIFLQNWEKCVFKVDPDVSSTGRYKEAVVVRLETVTQSTPRQFTLTAEIQKLASDVLPGLVPPVLQVGKVQSADGREYSFSVVKFVEGVTLNSVWANLNQSSRKAVVGDIVNALRKMYARGLSDESLQTVLEQAADSQEDATAPKPLYFGGAHGMVLTTGESLLNTIMEVGKPKRPFCDLEKDDELKSITIKSRFSDLGSLTIGQHEMDQWLEQAVLCHNDLSPNNLLLKETSTSSSENELEYRLAAVIDWELAGLYPAAYEAQLQDTYLAGGNRHVSFYLMLKKEVKAIVPCNKAQQTLLRAMELIFESRERHLFENFNIPAQIRKRFLSHCNLTRHPDPFAGWVNEVEDSAEYDADTLRQIEDDVVAESMARRAAKKQAKENAEKEEAEKAKTEKEKAGQEIAEHEQAKQEQVEKEPAEKSCE